MTVDDLMVHRVTTATPHQTFGHVKKAIERATRKLRFGLDYRSKRSVRACTHQLLFRTVLASTLRCYEGVREKASNGVQKRFRFVVSNGMRALAEDLQVGAWNPFGDQS